MAMRNSGIVLALLFGAICLSACRGTLPASPIQASFISASANSGLAKGFTRATPGRALSFPQDGGPHPDYQTEWWYYTGNLTTAEGQRFGYQLTFFRRALVPPGEVGQRTSDLATSQVYLAHFALTDVSRQDHQAFERFSRGAAGLAGAQATPYKVWVYDWNVKATGPRSYDLYAAQENYVLSLHLTDSKGPIMNGDNGYSQKGPEIGNASYYYSLTHLETEGSLQVLNQVYKVSGTSWMDHEFSTSALSSDQIGWDWFSIQLDDRHELMLFQIRRKDGTLDLHSGGTLISADGSYRHLKLGEFKITGTGEWISPHTNATYPSGWTVELPSENLTLDITPLVPDQEMNLSYSYWEGAVSIVGKEGGKQISGHGYVELTGYAGSIAGQF